MIIENLAKSYSRNHVFRGISVTFAPSRIAALVGPNGAGKTTLLRIAAGLQHPDDGTVRGSDAVYYGGFDTLPLRGTITAFRRTLGLWTDAGRGARRMATLSRGELHQAGLDAAFDLNRPILLLDEPWTALEPDRREALNRRLVATAAAGKVVVCSSHDLDEVSRVADDIHVLRDGKLRSYSRESDTFTRDELLAWYHR
jgi:ABC-type multidrug transport system ATPase subunit